MLTIYGISNCDTCRHARKWLDRHELEYRFYDVREEGLEIQMLERWAAHIEWEKLVNKRSLTWRKLPEPARHAMTKTSAMATMLEHPTLLKRPVLESDRFIAVGFTAEQYSDIFR